LKMRNICKATRVSITGLMFIPVVAAMMAAAVPFLLWDYIKKN
jgi:Na+/glutamate symporter